MIICSKEKSGQGVVEMALVLPIFVFIVIGIYDFGRVMHFRSNLNDQCVQAARTGARRIHPLIGKNVFSSRTHPSVSKICSAFWQSKSPIMQKQNYNSGNKENQPTIKGWGSASRVITVSATYNMDLIFPMLGKLMGGQNKSGELVLTASATEDKE